ncbi:putative Uracil-DNA glycosylase superfamily protein [Crocosphaera subtropica ATCC 51142]|uniref:Uracil-DNA glycosylase superfamily protein n=1 Tax=Crocosphaera subtropica (strain ATCC 51142 / BH68) TaxID=43989 RepID=B1WWQ3_CROS5|nr:uracil-DNA glycosylase family protein [Crocosphaera subtropica]ACB50777.1 putative Uracil-DNA glycosylase superfamily protein [Crocosphaera subtropica ATCC 51142]
MTEIKPLLEKIRCEAERETFPLDTPIYEAAGKNPTEPVLYAGNLNSKICFFGRDLGRDEVAKGQPLIGSAGTMVRKGFYQGIYHQEATSPEDLQAICDRALLTNTVPYKPPGNKAYSVKVKERFRPFIEQLLVIYWGGTQIVTLGTEAFKWFTPYAPKEDIEAFWKRSDRYEKQFAVTLEAVDFQGTKYQHPVSLLPLPHPSPLNKRYYAKFPQMLQHRLNELEF